jgi:uncharacterized protein (TIGR02996 family)
MNHEQAFLEDVIAHPDDDAPRLVFADWLDDHGQSERAELIRLQCEQARLDEAHPRHAELQTRASALLKKHGKRWAGPLAKLVEEVSFRRGFIEAVAVEDSPRFLAKAPQLFATAPIRALRLSQPGTALQHLIAPECLARLTSLDVDDIDQVPADVRDNLLASPALANLRTLLLESDTTEQECEASVRALATYPALAGLTELGLAVGTRTDSIDGDTVRPLLRARSLAKLERLYLPFTHLHDRAARDLASSRTLARLTHLDLGCATLSEAGWAELLRGGNLANLRWFGLFYATIDMGGAGNVELNRSALAPRFKERFGAALDYETSATFPRWKGQRLPSR